MAYSLTISTENSAFRTGSKDPASSSSSSSSSDDSNPDSIAQKIHASIRKGFLVTPKIPIPSIDTLTLKEHGLTAAVAQKMVESLITRPEIARNESSAQKLVKRVESVALEVLAKSYESFSTPGAQKLPEAVIVEHCKNGMKKFEVMRTSVDELYIIFPPILGKGAFKEVFFGLDVKSGAPLAIGRTDLSKSRKGGSKDEASSDEQEKIRQMGKKEVELVREIHRDSVKNGVMQVMDIVDLATGEQVVVMEFLSGGELNEVMIRQLPPEKLFRIANDIAEGLFHLHSCKIIHCDLKVQNIALTESKRAKIIDFGLSGKIADKITYKGTPTEWAPEIFAGKPASKESDIFSFGLILYKLFLEDFMEGDPDWKLKIHDVMSSYFENPGSNDAKTAYEELFSGDAPFLQGNLEMGVPFLEEDFSGEEPLYASEKTIRGLICRCCSYHPSERPDIEEVREDLKALQRAYLTKRRAALQEDPLKTLSRLFGDLICEQE